MSEQTKATLDRVTWLGRYADVFLRSGADEASALEYAIAAWDAADDDWEPVETAEADLAYEREDG